MKQPLMAAVIAVCAHLAAAGAAAEPSAAEQVLESRFKQLDKNRDGKVTTAELPHSSFFKQRDQNGDGAITLAEVKATATPSAADPGSSQAAPATNRKTAPLRRAPQVLKPADHGVGRLVDDIQFSDHTGKVHKLSDFSAQRAVVVALTSTSCPLSKKYFPSLAALAKTYSEHGITWVLLNPVATDRIGDMHLAAATVKGRAFYVHDRQGKLARALDAKSTGDVIVIDSARTVVFHGAIDDQYGFGYALDAPRQKYLADALDAILANRLPPIAATDAPGCLLNRDESPAAPADVTYYNRVARILQANCVECHRTDGVAPFPLTTLAEVTDHAAMIAKVVEEGRMPPWFAATDEQAASKAGSHWSNDRSLTSDDKRDLLAWIKGGQPPGDKSDAPQLRTYTQGWQIGKPDAVFSFPQAVPVKATGIMPYENVLIDTQLTEDQWVEAIEVQPGDRGVVHHMLVFLHTQVEGNPGLSTVENNQGNAFWGIYVPGNSTLTYGKGFAKRLPRGAKLHCQVHYQPNGTATTDRSRIGVIFAKQPPRYEVSVAAILNPHISIPPGAENHREEASLKLPVDIQVLSFLPHMHLRAKACRYRVIRENEAPLTLLDIPRYDFNWQLIYRYTEPQKLLRGDTIKFTVWYDNSANNPANPDPNQTVRFGQKITDEMHLGYLEYYIPSNPIETATAK